MLKTLEAALADVAFAEAHAQLQEQHDGLAGLLQGCPNLFEEINVDGLLRPILNFARGAEKFVCDVCGKGYANVGKLNRHKLSHSDKTFECPDCKLKFARGDAFKKHREGTKKCNRQAK